MSKFDLLEKKLNIASCLIDELEIDDCDVILPSTTPTESLPEISPAGLESSNEVFAIDTLKADFIMIRQNVVKLIATGQRVLDSASLIDVSDMTPAYLKSMSELQATLGSNLKLLVEIYTQLANIEKTRDKTKDKGKTGDAPAVINQGTITNNNNLVFTGSTDELLDILKNSQKQIT